MKKFFVLSAVALLSLTAMAQEKRHSVEWGFGLGMNHYASYPALSLFSGNATEYKSQPVALYVGQRTGDVLVALNYQTSLLQTSATGIGEKVGMQTFGLKCRYYGHLGEHLDPFAGIGLGYGWLHNSYEFLDTTYTYNRHALYGELEVGIVYHTRQHVYFGVEAVGSFFGPLANQKYNRPSELLPSTNNANDISSFGVRITVGWNF